MNSERDTRGHAKDTGDAHFTARTVRDFWFGEGSLDDPDYVAAGFDVWFKTDFAYDVQLRTRFEALVEHARAGACDSWIADPHAAVALVIVLDQIPRNIYRGAPAAFASDARALRISEQVLDAGDDTALSLIERVFLHMPFEHAEDLASQDRCVAGYRQLYDVAPPAFKPLMKTCVEAGEAHRDVIRRFGRFPHRNPIIGRASTPEELDWAAGHHGWGQGEAVLTRRDESA